MIAVTTGRRDGAPLATVTASMLFCIECSLLTDAEGRGVPLNSPGRVTFRSAEAADAASAIRAAALEDGAEIVDRVHQIDELQALATVSRGKRAMMLHAYPEAEASWRQKMAGA